MKKLLATFLAFLGLLLPSGASAQLYVTDNAFEDSVEVHPITVSEKSGAEIPGISDRKIPVDTKIQITGQLIGNESYGRLMLDGKEYAIHSSDIIFSDDNPEGVEDTFGNTRERTNHSAIYKFYAGPIPYTLICILFVAAMAFMFVGIRVQSARNLALKVVPACIIVASILEIVALYTMGNTAFWWCSPERYGFFGSLFRAIPFVVFVAFQIFSIKFYKQLLLGPDSEEDLSLKPMAISIAVSLPALIVVAIVCALLKVPNALMTIFCLVAFFATLGIGLRKSTKENIAVLGRTAGIAFTLFAAVYIVGTLVALWGLIVVIFKLIIQILMILAAIVGAAFVMGQNSGSGSSQPRQMFYDKSGKAHYFAADRDSANKKIDENRANS